MGESELYGHQDFDSAPAIDPAIPPARVTRTFTSVVPFSNGVGQLDLEPGVSEACATASARTWNLRDSELDRRRRDTRGVELPTELEPPVLVGLCEIGALHAGWRVLTRGVREPGVDERAANRLAGRVDDTSCELRGEIAAHDRHDRIDAGGPRTCERRHRLAERLVRRDSAHDDLC